MSRDALAFLISGLKLAYFAKDTTYPRPGDGGGRASAHRSTRPRRQSHHRFATGTGRDAGPGRRVSGRRTVGQRGQHQVLLRAAGHVLLPARARRFHRAEAAVTRVRAVLHAGDHGNAQAVAGSTAEPVQPACGRAADADAALGRVDPARARDLRGNGTSIRGAGSDARGNGPHHRCRRSRRCARRHLYSARSAAARGADRQAAVDAHRRGDVRAGGHAADNGHRLRRAADDGRARRSASSSLSTNGASREWFRNATCFRCSACRWVRSPRRCARRATSMA